MNDNTFHHENCCCLTCWPSLRMAEKNLDMQMRFVEDEQICGVWPDGTAIRGKHIKNLIQSVRDERAQSVGADTREAGGPSKQAEVSREG